MNKEKFDSEIQTLKKFFEIYCEGKEHTRFIHNIELNYQNHSFSYEFHLCNDCNNLIKYSIDRLENCPHEIKPKCRTCPTPCYEKTNWKRVAKIMKYSGIKLGLSKIKRFLRLD